MPTPGLLFSYVCAAEGEMPMKSKWEFPIAQELPAPPETPQPCIAPSDRGWRSLLLCVRSLDVPYWQLDVPYGHWSVHHMAESGGPTREIYRIAPDLMTRLGLLASFVQIASN